MAEGTRPQMVNPEPAIDLSELQGQVSSVLSPLGFGVFSPFAERHGSWEITLHQQTNEINRFISLDLTSEFAPVIETQKQAWLVEIWIGAEQDDRFMRRMFRQFTATKSEFSSPSFDQALSQALTQATELVLKLGTIDLIARYSERRVAPGERRIPDLKTPD